MKIITVGSLNYDYVYQLDHIIRPKETETAEKMETFCGGKGLNQSVAIARAGVSVSHAGMVGQDGDLLRQVCLAEKIDTTYLKTIPGKSGHTIIQVDREAENAILLYPGANRCLTKSFVDEVLSGFSKGDLLVLQNEVNELPYIIEKAYQRGLSIVLNPSPFDAYIKECDLTKISFFLLNEIEGEQLTKQPATEPEHIMAYMKEHYPKAAVLVTLGKEGALYQQGGRVYRQEAYPVHAVDTTGAGDTFTGYFIAGLAEKLTIPEILRRCAMASSIAVTRAGAVQSIPKRKEVEEALRCHTR